MVGRRAHWIGDTILLSRHHVQDENERVVLNVFVKPEKPVVSYLTPISGYACGGGVCCVSVNSGRQQAELHMPTHQQYNKRATGAARHAICQCHGAFENAPATQRNPGGAKRTQRRRGRDGHAKTVDVSRVYPIILQTCCTPIHTCCTPHPHMLHPPHTHVAPPTVAGTTRGF